MDHYIHGEIDILFAVFRDLMAKHPEQKETGHDFLKVLPAVAINTLWYIIAGEIHGLENEHFIRLTRLVLKFFRLGDQTSPVPIYRLLQHIPVINNNFKQQEKCGEEIMTFIQEAVVRHVETFNENDMRDFMDVYIREMKKDTDGSFSENQLISICMDLFLAGTETTASTTTFTLRYLIKYPEIQEKVRNEIYQVVGKDRLPSTEDMPNLHYCMAVLTESMRHSGVTPSTPPKSTVKDVNFQGYNIPKGCMMLVNLRSVNMDEKHLGDPETFRPERFIGPDGKFHKDEKLMLFGSGTRMCLGEPFAKNTTFIFYTSIVQNFKLEVAPYGPKPSEVILDGFTTAPEPFKMTMTALN
ncbi:methyl farnesoate epoxidase-like [Cloeon dipterum]|uniref:methyl farnesoate epoxidase-like n=1 Tax=Cloeon dipterum TaxID=197152 RepID=UPI00321FE371